MRIHHHAKFQAIPSMPPAENAQRSLIWPPSLHETCAKIRKITRLWPKHNQFGTWSGYISMSNFRPFLPWGLKKMCRNLNFNPFHRVKIATKLGKSTDCDKNLINSEGDQDTSESPFSGQSFHAFSRKCVYFSNLIHFTESKLQQKLGKSTDWD